MSKKFQLTERQKRVLAKLGLLPLTNAKKISERFGIPAQTIRLAREQSNTRQREVRDRLVKRFSSDPALRGLLSHPKLWIYPIIQSMAAENSITDIRHELIRVAHGRSVPSESVIHAYIQRTAPRTPEEKYAIQVKKRRRKQSNRLSEEQRNFLREAAFEFFATRLARGLIRRGRTFTAEDMRDWMIGYAVQDAATVKLRPDMKNSELKSRWFAYLVKASRFYSLNAFNRIVRRRDSERLFAESEERLFPAEKEPIDITEIQFTSSLTPRQREFFELFAAGTKLIDIARRMKISAQAVDSLKNNVTKKIKK